MSNTINPLLRKGILAAKAGHRTQSRRLLLKALEQMPRNETVWLWLAYVAADLDERIAYLQQALAINPHNKNVKSALQKLTSQAQKPAWQCPICAHTADKGHADCPQCGSHLGFDDPAGLADRAPAQIDRLRPHINRLKKGAHQHGRANDYRLLALAYLNVGQIPAAVANLRTAVRMEPNPTLQAALDQLLQAQQPPAPAGPTVLVVDDSPTIRALVSSTLKRNGFEVLTAADGLDALAQLNDTHPDVILLDITMPRMDGYQLSKIVTQNDETADIPVIMLSGKDGFFDKVRGRMAGATAYLTKPFQPQQLLNTVQQHLARREATAA